MSHEDQKYINALCENDCALIEEIYQKCSPNCVTFVKRNSGTEIDAADIFQEAIVEVYLKCKELVLSVPICAYLSTIYKRKWINKLNRRKNFVRILGDIGYIHKDNKVASPDIISGEQKMEKIFKACFKELDKKCQEILNMYNDGISGKEMAEKLGIKRNNVFRQKFNCLDKLKACCEQHPDFKDLMQ